VLHLKLDKQNFFKKQIFIS